MAYVRKGDNASSRHPFYGIDKPPSGPVGNSRTAEQVYADAQERKTRNLVKVDLRNFLHMQDKVAAVQSALTNLPQQHSELQPTYGAFCTQALTQLNTICNQIRSIIKSD